MIRRLITCQSLLLGLVLAATNLFAQSPETGSASAFRSSCYVNKDGQIRLAVDKTTLEPVSVVLRRDGQRLALLTKYIAKKRSKFAYVFDFSELPDGLYSLELSDGQQLITHQVTIATRERPTRQIALQY